MTRKRSKPTFIEEARRKQIVDATISVIAETGYLNTSLAEIAKHADISKGVISYHFNGKDELIDETINTVLSDSYRYIKGQVQQAGDDHRAQLRTYIEASFDYMAANRSHFVALVDLWGSFSSYEAKKAYNKAAYDPCRRHLSTILEPAQKNGEFLTLPITPLASIIQAAIDGIMLQWVMDEDAVDFEMCKEQVVRLFDTYIMPCESR